MTTKISKSKFLYAIQARAARVTVGASAVHGGGAGVAHAAREFFVSLPLGQFSIASQKAFASRLDATTASLQSEFPKGSGSWGLARKLLNIFLREALYTKYLTEKYNLAKSESFLEVPLDRITAARLRNIPSSGLVAWPKVKYLTPDVSAEYQAVAESHASDLGISRIHLDAIWWGQRDATPSASKKAAI